MQRICAIFLFIFFSVTTWAQDSQVIDTANAPYTEGKDYLVLPESYSQDTTAQASLLSHPDKVEVLAFFNYGCPVCYRMEPVIEEWHRSKEDTQQVGFTDVPVAWNHPGWENLARAFYIAEALNVLDTVHPRLFRAIHQQGNRFATKEELEEFFIAEGGVSREDFNDNYDSFTTRRRLKQADLLRSAYKIRAIPAFVVNGKYLVDVQTAGNVDRTVEVLDFLVNKESFTEGAEELKFDEVNGGIDHSEDDVYELGDEQENRENLAPSTAPE